MEKVLGTGDLGVSRARLGDMVARREDWTIIIFGNIRAMAKEAVKENSGGRGQ